jgi:hypothetical protein
MGFMGSTTDSALTLMGTLYFSAGIGLYLASILEWYALIEGTICDTDRVIFAG